MSWLYGQHETVGMVSQACISVLTQIHVVKQTDYCCVPERWVPHRCSPYLCPAKSRVVHRFCSNTGASVERTWGKLIVLGSPAVLLMAAETAVSLSVDYALWRLIEQCVGGDTVSQ